MFKKFMNKSVKSESSISSNKIKELASNTVQELLDLSDIYEWHTDIKTLSEYQHRYMQQWYDAYVDWKVSGFSTNSEISFFNNGKSSGFALHLKEVSWSQQTCLEFLKHLSFIMKKAGYILQLSDVRTKANIIIEEQIFRIYLKPSARISTGNKSVQLYGNIVGELILKNEQLQLLRVILNTYQDSNFHEAGYFGEFLESLFLGNKMRMPGFEN
jgi:hypothetical protein